jgi:hypothetical protein
LLRRSPAPRRRRRRRCWCGTLTPMSCPGSPYQPASRQLLLLRPRSPVRWPAVCSRRRLQDDYGYWPDGNWTVAYGPGEDNMIKSYGFSFLLSA